MSSGTRLPSAAADRETCCTADALGGRQRACVPTGPGGAPPGTGCRHGQRPRGRRASGRVRPGPAPLRDRPGGPGASVPYRRLRVPTTASVSSTTCARSRDDRPADSPSTARNALVMATAIRPGSNSAMLPLRRSTVMPVVGVVGVRRDGGTVRRMRWATAWIVLGLGVILSPREKSYRALPDTEEALQRGWMRRRPEGSRGSHRPSLGVAQQARPWSGRVAKAGLRTCGQRNLLDPGGLLAVASRGRCTARAPSADAPDLAGPVGRRSFPLTAAGQSRIRTGFPLASPVRRSGGRTFSELNIHVGVRVRRHHHISGRGVSQTSLRRFGVSAQNAVPRPAVHSNPGIQSPVSNLDVAGSIRTWRIDCLSGARRSADMAASLP